MTNCNICNREMDTDPTMVDCGGDCLRCMAEIGDPDCEDHLALVIRNTLYSKIHDLIDAELKDVPLAVEESVRERMNDDFRFWKRVM